MPRQMPDSPNSLGVLALKDLRKKLARTGTSGKKVCVLTIGNGSEGEEQVWRTNPPAGSGAASRPWIGLEMVDAVPRQPVPCSLAETRLTHNSNRADHHE